MRVDTTPAVEWIDASSADERIADKRADAGASPDDARVDATSAVEWIDALLPSRADATSAVEWIDASSADERMAAGARPADKRADAGASPDDARVGASCDDTEGS